jgi:hypothetical protein
VLQSYAYLVSGITEFHEKYAHLTQIYETEAKTKWHYVAQIEELSSEVRELRDQVSWITEG